MPTIGGDNINLSPNFTEDFDSKIDKTQIDIDSTLSANSDDRIPSQKAIKSYVDSASAETPDATTLIKGKVQLAGDLGGTADAPTVPALSDKEETSNKDVDGTLSSESDIKYPSQKAVKSYVDTGLVLKENVSNKDTDIALSADSDTKYPSQKAIKAYVDTGLGLKQDVADMVADVPDIIGSAFDLTGYDKDTGRTQSELLFDDLTRTVTIQPKAPYTSFDIWVKGVKQTISSPVSKQINNIEGNHYLYFDETFALRKTEVFSIDLIYKLGYTASVYWSVSSQKFIVRGDERHGSIMDFATHGYLHTTRGTQYVSGLNLGDITADSTGSTDSNVTFSVSDGSISDEDIIISIANGSPQTISTACSFPILYRSGSNWLKTTESIYPVRTAGTGRASYNLNTAGVWSQSEVPNGNYVLAHVFATNDVLTPIMVVQGQNQYISITSARAGATTELNSLVLTGLPAVEWKAIGSIIIQTSDTYTNAVKSRIRTTDNGGTFIDWRFSYGTPATGVSQDHGNLTGLNDLDHPASAIKNTPSLYFVSTNVQGAIDELCLSDLFNVKTNNVNQSINGVKTFTSSPIVPNPTLGTDATNKQTTESLKFGKYYLKNAKVISIKHSPISNGDEIVYTVPAGKKAYLSCGYVNNYSGSTITTKYKVGSARFPTSKGVIHSVAGSSSTTSFTPLFSISSTPSPFFLEAGETMIINVSASSLVQVQLSILEFDNIAGIKTNLLTFPTTGVSSLTLSGNTNGYVSHIERSFFVGIGLTASSNVGSTVFNVWKNGATSITQSITSINNVSFFTLYPALWADGDTLNVDIQSYTSSYTDAFAWLTTIDI